MAKPVSSTNENIRPPLRDSTNARSPLNSSDSILSIPGRFYTAEIYDLSHDQFSPSESGNTPSIRRIISDPFPVPDAEPSSSPLTVHHPHQLDTIIETRSNLTRRVSRLSNGTQSQDHSQDPDSGSSQPQARTRSFSLDHLRTLLYPAKPNRDHRKLFLSTSSSSSCCFATSTPSYPLSPPLPRPTAPPTPPNLPTFNTQAAASYRLPPPSPPSPPHLSITPRTSSLPFGTRIAQAFSIPAAVRPIQQERQIAEELEWHRATSSLPRGAIMRAPDGTLIKGTWKPSQSGHTGVPSRRGRSRRGMERTREREAERRGGGWAESGALAVPVSVGEQRTEAEMRARGGREMERGGVQQQQQQQQGEARGVDGDGDGDGDGDVEAQAPPPRASEPGSDGGRGNMGVRKRDGRGKMRERLARVCEELCPCCYEDAWESASEDGADGEGNGNGHLQPTRPRTRPREQLE
ncbi:hypothetical protein MMC10_004828 [Thelotrema lepadinum]|nr:hypothetical protein [Thelotrema lepadinum]